jgi:hypothetical protein
MIPAPAAVAIAQTVQQPNQLVELSMDIADHVKGTRHGCSLMQKAQYQAPLQRNFQGGGHRRYFGCTVSAARVVSAAGGDFGIFPYRGVADTAREFVNPCCLHPLSADHCQRTSHVLAQIPFPQN